MGTMTDKLDEVRTTLGHLGKHYPNEIQGFTNFMAKAESGTALDASMKEVINVALSVAAQCDWCIAFHVDAAVKAGATRDQMMEAGFMAVLMHGGPALMYLTPLVNALDEFLPDSSE